MHDPSERVDLEKRTSDLVIAGLVGRAAEEGGDVGELDRVNGRTEQVVVKRGQIVCAAKDDVGSVFGLGNAPVIAAERSEIGDVARDGSIHARMQLGHGQLVG